MIRPVSLTILTMILAAPALGGECSGAHQLYNQAIQNPAEQERLLEQLLALCPTHLEGLNNLAVLREQQGRLDQAEALYRRIIEQQESFAAAHAGLGDVLASLGRHREAALSYGAFLELLAHDGQNPLKAYEGEYRLRLAAAQEKIDPVGTVSAEAIASALSIGEAGGRRGFKRVLKPPHIDIPIHFKSGSDQLLGESAAQVAQLAQALQHPELQYARFTIEGHTDATGSSNANQKLSQRRAEQVRRLLVEKHGLSPDRFQVVGRGEDHPVADNATEHGKALNRRVTIINEGDS